MPIATVCYACRSPIQATVSQVVECACSAAFVVIPGFAPLSTLNSCYRLKDALLVLSFGPNLPSDIRQILEDRGIILLDPQALYPMFVDLSDSDSEKIRLCRWDCSWGSNYFHLVATPTPTNLPGYLIFPLEKLSTAIFYHGTSEGGAVSIFSSNALLPPHVTGNKTHGFSSEEDLRYAGIDKSSAEAHDKGALIELEFSGWIAKTHLGLPPKALLHLLDAMPQEVRALEFWEDGRSVAFRRDAQIVPAKTANNEALKDRYARQSKKGLIDTLRQWFS